MRATQPATQPTTQPTGRFLLGFVVLYAVLAGLAELGADGWHGVSILAVVTGAAFLVDRAGGQQTIQSVFSRPSLRALTLALAVAALIQVTYPLVGAFSGGSLTLKDDWPVLLLGVLAFHGLAEELVWRGYTFRLLRKGRSFGHAVLLSMPLIAATHIPIIASSGLTVGLAAMLVAAVTSLPFARLFELGNNTIWAPAVLHAGIDSFMVVDVSDDARLAFSLTLSTVSLLVPLLVFIRLPKEKPCPSRATSDEPR